MWSPILLESAMAIQMWRGKVPDCDFCKRPMGNEFVDGATQNGQWAYMCMLCYADHGVLRPLGTGTGQKYRKGDDGKYYKVIFL